MVAHRFVESLLSRADDGPPAEEGWKVTVIGEEPRHPYDRVALTSFFGGASPEDLTLDPSFLDTDPRVRFVRGDAVARIDRSARRVTTASGLSVGYDRLVLATGSYAARLAVDGFDHDGCFVYRTLDDVEKLRAFVRAPVGGARPDAPRHGDRRRPARPRGRRGHAGARRRLHRRAVLGSPDVRAAR